MYLPKPFCIFALGLLIFAAAPFRTAEARPMYYRLWIKKYPKVVEQNNVKVEVTCNVCHVPPRKTMLNAYGKALAKAFGGQKNVRIPKAINDTLTEIEAQNSEVKGMTFGNLLKAGNLPSQTE